MKSHYCLLFALCAFPCWLTAQMAGTPDPAFGQDGEVVVADPMKTYYGGHTVLLPDGKLIVAGNEYDENGQNGIIVLTRLQSNGAIDLSYGINGQARPNLDNGFDGGINNIALTENGQLIIAGNIVTDTSSAAFAARLDANGELDLSFGQAGVATFDVGDDEDDFSTVLVKPDGNILLGGLTYDLDNAGFYDFLLVQLLPDGTPDLSFGTQGITTADFANGLEGILSLALQADGKIVAAGANAVADYDMEIVRFHPDGTVDPSFANNGAFTFGLATQYEIAYAVAVQADQKIVFCGTSFQNNSTAGASTLFRLLSDGSFDSGFGTGGQVLTELGVFDFARTLLLQPDGKILVGAESMESGSNLQGRLWVVRYHTDGSLDHTFGNNGKVQTPTYAEAPEAVDLLLQPDGNIIQTGTADQKIVLWRYLNAFMVGTEETTTTDFQLQCSPNPLAESANLSWVQKESGELHCNLYDAQGRLLQTVMPPAFSPAGAHRQALCFGGEIPTGVCFLVFQVDKQRQVLRLTKM